MWSLIRTALFSALVAVFGATPALARDPLVYTGTFSSTAVGGYDPVAYFTENKPVKGNSNISSVPKPSTAKGAMMFIAEMAVEDSPTSDAGKTRAATAQ